MRPDNPVVPPAEAAMFDEMVQHWTELGYLDTVLIRKAITQEGWRALEYARTLLPEITLVPEARA